ncbi:MAG: hypothetical protein K2X27_24090, partial [Candidatus Obscuribacterales bacterium]|nr:hypothetical protein [Candidatus Obscuribacterales bacterium]
MANNSKMAAPGGAVAEEEKLMSYQNQEQIGNIEKDLEKAESDFRQAAQAKDLAGMERAHEHICRLVAALSACYSGGNPTVFARFHIIPQTAETTKEESSSAKSEDEIPDIAALEKQLAELASRMQKCLEAGDMDGMLQANERMGALSELMAKAEARSKEKAKVQAPSENKAAETQAQSQPASSAWSAGDTLALAKQRAEERKKQLKLNDSFESVVTEVIAPDSAAAPAQDSAASALFNERMKNKLKESGEKAAPKKSAMTQEQLRERLEQYSF